MVTHTSVMSSLRICTLLMLALQGAAAQNSSMKRSVFGRTPDGTSIYLYTLKNSSGMEAQITNYGGIIVRLLVPDRSGRIDDVVLGYDSLADYIKDNPYFGCIAGRYANRIAAGKFSLNGKEYTLARNNGPNHLHGGNKGFDKMVWEPAEDKEKNGQSLTLSYLSKDGEEGYPGNLSVKVKYTVTDQNELKIQYSATTDSPTVVNLTQHSYFNLAGAGKGDILSEELMINADRFTPVDSTLIPTGELREVRGTPMDFTRPTAIGARIDSNDEQLHFGRGYDHNFVLRREGRGLVLAARVYDPGTGRLMEVSTTEPGVQFYSGNFLDGHNIGKGGRSYKHRYGFCLETQHFPDSPNHPSFPSVMLKPGEVHTSTTVYKFSVR